MLADLTQVEALGPQILDIGERGGLPWRYVGYVYLGLAAHWRDNAERAEAEFRKAVEMEPPGAIGGQSVSLLARHLAYQGRTEEVMELFESARPRLPSLDRCTAASARGIACSASLRPSTCVSCMRRLRRCPRLSKECSRSVRGWITFDGRLVETRAGIAAAAAGRWETAEHYFGMAREAAEEMSNRLELADLDRLHARMLLDRGDTGDYARAAEMLEKALAAYRDFGIPAYAAEAERLRSQALA